MRCSDATSGCGGARLLSRARPWALSQVPKVVMPRLERRYLMLYNQSHDTADLVYAKIMSGHERH
jgi:hypothetical protein